MSRAYLTLFILSVLLFISCSEDFDINAPRKEVYVLNCILQNDNIIQFVMLTRNIYTENGAPPNTTPDNNYVKNAIIKIYYNNSVYLLRDTTIQLTEDSVTKQINCYYLKNLVINSGTSISIEAITPDGQKLQSTINIPEIIFQNYSYRFPGVYISGLEYVTVHTFGWVTKDNFLSLPQLCIQYKKLENGKYIDKEAFVLLYSSFLKNSDGTIIGVPIQPSFSVTCEMSLEEINKAMKGISGDDPFKSNYTITNIQFDVIGLDASLSRYYTSVNTFEKSFTVKIRPTDYTNIVGGLGVFGVRYKYSKPMLIDSLYVRSFGYKYTP
jgi:hypothetical protein